MSGTRPYVVTFARPQGTLGQVVLAADGLFAALDRARQIAAQLAETPTPAEAITPVQLADAAGQVLWASDAAWAATPCLLPWIPH